MRIFYKEKQRGNYTTNMISPFKFVSECYDASALHSDFHGEELKIFQGRKKLVDTGVQKKEYLINGCGHDFHSDIFVNG